MSDRVGRVSWAGVETYLRLQRMFLDDVNGFFEEKEFFWIVA